MPPLGLERHPRRAAVEAGYIVLGMVPAHHGLRRRLGMRQQFDKIPHLAVKVSLGWIMWLWQHLQQDCGCRDILTCTELLRELHAGVVDDVVVDRTCASMRRAGGVDPF